ncbi:MAG: AAA family ATPase, partial [Candidatus Competibacter sp.]|nr:AAA family ATPase [Candidatus Competibacter sp.]
MNAPYHSTFTPSQSDPETLEDLFVAREKLAQRILDGIQESAAGANKHQRLLIGPRGIGKTHLVALLHHRVRRDAELDKQLRIAWLPEDPYIAGYQNLLLLILQTLQRTYQLEDLRQHLEDILDLEGANQAEPLLERLLVEFVGDKTLLLIIENLDDLLANLKETGQRKLRAFLQNHPMTTLLATATSLSEAVADRKNTFHGFFKIHSLDPFTVEDAVRLLTRMAQRTGSDDLANALCSPMGRARIRAVHYLAGGNPRIYVVFYDFLTRESLDDLVRPFMKLIDELTPYYQARMDRLAPLQRGIIDIMRRLRGAVTIKEIARQAMNTSQTISAQLGRLKDLGYVIQAAALGRSNYYELREPLMRFCLEVKEQRGRTVELFVQFLRVWYSETELARLALDGVISLEQTHLREAMQRTRSGQDPVCSMLKTEFQAHQDAGDYQAALEAAELAIQRNNDDKESWVCKAQCLEALGHSLEERLACWRRVAEIDPS